MRLSALLVLLGAGKYHLAHTRTRVCTFTLASLLGALITTAVANRNVPAQPGPPFILTTHYMLLTKELEFLERSGMEKEVGSDGEREWAMRSTRT